MKNRNYMFVSITIIALFFMKCSSNEPKTQQVEGSQPTTENNIEHGKILFEEKCAICHGGDGTAGISNAANLQTSKLDTLSVIRIITNGKNTMPAFREPLGTGEIEQIAHYVFTLRK